MWNKSNKWEVWGIIQDFGVKSYWTSCALQVGNPFEHETYYGGSVSRGKILVLNYSDVISSVFINGFLFIRKIVTVVRWPCASAPFGGPHSGGGYKTESDLWLCRWFSCCRPWLCICLWHLYTKTCEYSVNFAVGCSEFPSNCSLCLSPNDELACDNYP